MALEIKENVIKTPRRKEFGKNVYKGKEISVHFQFTNLTTSWSCLLQLIRVQPRL